MDNYLRPYRGIIVAIMFVLAAITGFAETRAERKARRNAESAAPAAISPVAAGVKFDVNKPYADAFAATIRSLVENGYTIETANKETYSIITTMAITGGYRQQGARILVTVLDKGSLSTVAVLVTVQDRFNGLQAEPWSLPKPEPNLTQQLADKLKEATAK